MLSMQCVYMEDQIMTSRVKTYSELIKLKTFEERFRYLSLNGGRVGEDTFGQYRYINQKFYNSLEWRRIKDSIIIRDNGCDLGIDGFELGEGDIIIHHMNPLLIRDLLDMSDYVKNPEFLITVSLNTHNAIHYGSMLTLNNRVIRRAKNDTCPWKQ